MLKMEFSHWITLWVFGVLATYEAVKSIGQGLVVSLLIHEMKTLDKRNKESDLSDDEYEMTAKIALFFIILILWPMMLIWIYGRRR